MFSVTDREKKNNNNKEAFHNFYGLGKVVGGFFCRPFFKLSCTFLLHWEGRECWGGGAFVTSNSQSRKTDPANEHYNTWLEALVLTCTRTFHRLVKLRLVGTEREKTLPSDCSYKRCCGFQSPHRGLKTRQQIFWRVELKGNCRLIHFAWAAPSNIDAGFFHT